MIRKSRFEQCKCQITQKHVPKKQKSNKFTGFASAWYFGILNMLTSYVFHIIIHIDFHIYSVNEFYCWVTYCVIFDCLSDFWECSIGIHSNLSGGLLNLRAWVSESIHMRRSKSRMGGHQCRRLDFHILKNVLSRIIFTSKIVLVRQFLQQLYNVTIGELSGDGRFITAA